MRYFLYLTSKTIIKCAQKQYYASYSKAMQKNSDAIIPFKLLKPIRVVFDLDYALISDICEVKRKSKNFDTILQNVGEDSIIESCGYYFYLYNGWKELIKYAMELSDDNLIFFSSGARERNEDIIPKIIERVLEREPTEYMRNNVKIFSRDHTIDTTRMSDGKSEKFQLEGMYGQKKKDLNVAVSSDELKYTLLIDDDESYLIPDQKKNFLKIDGQSAKYNLDKCRKISQQELASFPEDLRMYDSFFTFNKLIYAAGVLRDVCDKYSREDRDLVDIMWDSHGFKDREQIYELPMRVDLYHSGLEVLKEINSDVGFLMATSDIKINLL